MNKQTISDQTKMKQLMGQNDEPSELWEGEGFLKDKTIVKDPEIKITNTYNMRELYQSTTPWELQSAVSDWEQGETDAIKYTIDPILTEKREELAPGTCPGGPNVGKPFFQFLPLRKSFEEGGTMVAESDNCISFIPAGFRGGKTPNTMNPVREELAGTSALMSLVHVLTIPKTKRIYNAATLQKDHIPLLKEMKQLGELSVNRLMNGSKTQLGSFKWVYSQDGEIEMTDGSKQSAKVVKEDLSPSCRENYHRKLPNPTIRNSFHVYPAASIGWLHLHSYVGELLTTAHDTMEREAKEKGYRKNVSYEQVLHQLM
jgi:hypothetical protein